MLRGCLTQLYTFSRGRGAPVLLPCPSHPYTAPAAPSNHRVGLLCTLPTKSVGRLRQGSTPPRGLTVFARRRASTGKMPRGVKKENLPTKVCVVCERPFTWRKKWERCWDEVTTCSKSCNAKRRSANKAKASLAIDQEPQDCIDTGISGHKDEATIPAEAGDAKPESDTSGSESDGSLTDREKRKAAKKAAKAARRAQREGRGDGGAGQKQCDGCSRMVDLLVRCTVDESQQWRMMCGKCWQGVSGGVADGDADHPHYRYGGLWKNRRANKSLSTTPPPLSGAKATL